MMLQAVIWLLQFDPCRYREWDDSERGKEGACHSIFEICFHLVSRTIECKYLIAPIHRKLDGTWFDSNTDELINMEKMWRPGQPNGGNLQECALYHGEDGNYYDDQCSYKSCFVCSWDKRPVFTLRGLCTDSNIDMKYNSVLVNKINSFVHTF